MLRLFASVNAGSGCTLDKVSTLPSALISPLRPNNIVKSEEASPMELAAEKRSSSVFKVSGMTGASALAGKTLWGLLRCQSTAETLPFYSV